MRMLLKLPACFYLCQHLCSDNCVQLTLTWCSLQELFFNFLFYFSICCVRLILCYKRTTTTKMEKRARERERRKNFADVRKKKEICFFSFSYFWDYLNEVINKNESVVWYYRLLCIISGSYFNNKGSCIDINNRRIRIDVCLPIKTFIFMVFLNHSCHLYEQYSIHK